MTFGVLCQCFSLVFCPLSLTLCIPSNFPYMYTVAQMPKKSDLFCVLEIKSYRSSLHPQSINKRDSVAVILCKPKPFSQLIPGAQFISANEICSRKNFARKLSLSSHLNLHVGSGWLKLRYNKLSSVSN